MSSLADMDKVIWNQGQLISQLQLVNRVLLYFYRKRLDFPRLK